MQRFDEKGVEKNLLLYLEDVGWNTWGDPENDIWGSTILNEKYKRKTDEIVYWEMLKEKIIELNDKIDEREAIDVIDSLKRDLIVENLVEGNKEFYKILRDGKKHTLSPEKGGKTIRVRLIAHPDDPDYDHPIDKNRFDAVTQFKVERPSKTGSIINIRPDIVLFVNGIPLVTMEMKSSAQDTNIDDAIVDMKGYEEKIPSLFVPNLLNGVCDGNIFKYASVGASPKFYFPWRSDDYEESEYQPENAVKSLFNHKRLLDIFRYFVFYEGNNKKIIPRYMQYYAANKILDRIIKGEPDKGLVWHTQGSGKSYTMLFTAYKGKKCPDIEDKQYLLIVDRKKLDEQMADTLSSIEFPLHEVAEDIEDLGRLLSQNKPQLILTTIHKFGGLGDDIDADVDLETVIMVDEAHRFMERKLGNKLKSAISNDYYFGFTGTPVKEGDNEKDRNTFKEFSPPEDEGYLHRYSLNDAKRDKVITRVNFTLKEIPWDIPEERKMDLEFEGEISDLDPEERRKVLRKFVNSENISILRNRIEKVIADIVDHYNKKVRPNGFKGMVVTPSRRAAALYGDELEKYFDSNEINVIVSSTGNDPEEVQRHFLTDEEESKAIKDFKEEENPKLLVVCKKLLTGFDAPILTTLYLDQSMKNHRLLQAIARTNRPMEGKANGEIVDYAGIFVDPSKVLEYGDIEFVTNVIESSDKIADEFLEKLEEMMKIFEDMKFDNNPKTLRKAVVKLEKDPDKGNHFVNLYKEAEDLFESASPHEKLGRVEVEEKWAILSQIYNEFVREPDGGDGRLLTDDIREKTKNILEKRMEFGKIGEGSQVVYEPQDIEVTVVDGDVEPDYEIVDEGGRMRYTYEREKEKNPVFSTLSDRVKKIMEKWRHDELPAEDALHELDEIEKEEETLKDKQEELGLDGVGFSLYQLINMEYSDFFNGEDEIAKVSNSLSDSISGLTLKGNLSQIKRDLRRKVIKVLAEEEKLDLIKYDEKAFLDDSIQYMMANME